MRNLADGSVEVMARGTGDAMSTFADELRSGPPMARVQEVRQIACILPTSADDFSIEHSIS